MNESEAAEAQRQALLTRVRSADFSRVPVVNSVMPPLPHGAVLAAEPTDRAGRRAAAKARRRAARDLRRRRRHPERYREEFTGWVAIPWQSRPIEARLSDYAHYLAAAIERQVAWSDPLLADHRAILQPQREAAEISVAAYRLYQARASAEPRFVDGRAEADAALLIDGIDHLGPTDQAFDALVDRVASLANYLDKLIRLRPLIEAEDARRRRSVAELAGGAAALFSDAARHELAAGDVQDLSASATALAELLSGTGRQPTLEQGDVGHSSR